MAEPEPELFPSWASFAFSPEYLLRLAETEDEIGFVLHAHLMSEEWLTKWCEAQLNKPDLLNGLRLGYTVRLQLAIRLGLPKEAEKAFTKLNEIRNRLGHRLGYELSASEINAFAEAVDQLKTTNGQNAPCSEQFIQTWNADGTEKIQLLEGEDRAG